MRISPIASSRIRGWPSSVTSIFGSATEEIILRSSDGNIGLTFKKDFSLSEDECKRYAEGLTDKFEYYKKDTNTSCDPEDKITTLDDCKEAVNSLNLNLTQDWVGGANNPDNLGGCFIEGNVIRFNKLFR